MKRWQRRKRAKTKPVWVSTFVDPLVYEPTGTFRSGRPEYSLSTPFIYEVGQVGSGMTITVPKGFVTDFASVPRGFRWAIKPDGAYSQAACLHDFLYLKGLVSRWMADRILFEAMIPLNIPLPTRLIIYFAVRLGGWRYYDRKNLSVVQRALNDMSDDGKIVVPHACDNYSIEEPDLGY